MGIPAHAPARIREGSAQQRLNLPHTLLAKRPHRPIYRTTAALLDTTDGPRPAPVFVEWLMGLPTGWATDSEELMQSQQITAPDNRAPPLQAVTALSLLTA